MQQYIYKLEKDNEQLEVENERLAIQNKQYESYITSHVNEIHKQVDLT